MHIYFITRGINQQVELWKKFMETQMYPFPRKNLETGEVTNGSVQGALRPVQMWEYVFPEECLQEVVNNLNDTKLPEKYQKYVRLMQKMIGLESVPPKSKDAVKTRMMDVFGVSLHLIGIKKEPKRDIDFSEWGQGKFYQEPL